MLYWLIARTREDKKRLKRRTSDYMPDYTGHVALVMVAVSAVVLFLLIGIQAAHATNGPVVMYVNVNADSWLNVRALADTEAEIEFCLDRGAEVVVLKAGKYWCRIGYEGREGWAAREYLSADRPYVGDSELSLEVEPDE